MLMQREAQRLKLCSSLAAVPLATLKLSARARKFPPAFTFIAALLALMAACSRAQSTGESKPAAPTQSAVMRSVTVKFDYDFTKFPPCSEKITKKCVKQFNVYEVSGDKPIFLFSIPVPPNAKGKMTGINGSAPQKHPFFTGPHRFGVSAKGPDPNYESNPYDCVTFAQVLPDNQTPPTPGNSPPKK
jgi:hypothetical protein